MSISRVAASVLLVALLVPLLVCGGCRRAPEEPTPRPEPTPPAAPSLSSAEAGRLNDRGVGLMGMFEFEAAEEAFREALRGELDAEAEREVRVNAAIALMNQSAEGRQEAALADLMDLLNDTPTHLRAHYASGLSQLFLGRADLALPHFAVVADAVPDDPYAAHYHAQCLELDGQNDRALEEYLRSIELDPYLRSPMLGAQRTLVRLGRDEEATHHLELFQRLAENPRGRLVEFKYTRMGRLGEAVPVDHRMTLTPLPDGPRFGAPRTLYAVDSTSDAMWSPRSRTSVTAADVTGDGRREIIIAGAEVRRGRSRRNIVLSIDEDGSATRLDDHPFADLADTRFILWGDLNNDGRLDAVVAADAHVSVMRQDESNAWRDITGDTGIDHFAAPARMGFRFVHGLLVDIDHDGDLDLILCLNGEPDAGDGVDAGFGEVRLYHNLDGTRFAHHELPLPDDRIGFVQAIAADFDGDRDLDLLLVRAAPPHVLLRNDRLWEWTPWPVIGDAMEFPAHAAVAGDLNGDGTIEALLLGDGEARQLRVYDGVATSEAWMLDWPGGDVALADLRGDGQLEPFSPDESLLPEGVSLDDLRGWALVTIDPARGPSLVVVHDAEDRPGGVDLLPPGPGRHDFASVDFRGRTDPGQSMRSNASGVGTLVNARAAGRWITRAALPMASMPGQSLEPVSIGLGGADAARFISIDWPDGVFQSEMALGAGAHEVVETQRIISSCPLLFVWDGERFAFVSDFLGVGGIGYLIEPGHYAESRPWENLLLPVGLAVPRDGAYEMRIHEPMEEAVYLDQVRLHAIDLPPGWQVTVDERMGLGEPMPTGDIVTYRHVRWPDRAVDQDGVDITESLRAVDTVAAPVPEPHTRWLGRLVRESVITLHFDEALAAPSSGVRPILIGDGWVEYPYSQTNFAAWQAGVNYDPPLIEARGADGIWHVVADRTGYPAGMPREMSWPLPTLPEGTDAIRLSTTLEIHWDALRVAWAESCDEMARHELRLIDAELRSVGYPRRTLGPSRRPHYDYDQLDPLADMKMQPGYYTTLGPVLELLEGLDDALVVFGAGEEVAVRFDATLPDLPEGWTRRLMLETHGWCKDMDLFTRDGETLAPIPSGGRPSETRERLHGETLRRWMGGR